MQVLRFNYCEQEEIRVDKFLESVCENFSRSYIQKLIKDSCLKINNKEIKKPGFKIKNNDELNSEIRVHESFGSQKIRFEKFKGFNQ